MNKSDILDFIRDAGEPVSKREIARALKIKGSGPRTALKHALKNLEKEELIAKKPGGKYTIPEGLPGVTVIEVTDIDIDGDVFARPAEWDEKAQGPPPRIEIMPDNRGHPALTPHDRVLARLERVDENTYEARTIKHLEIPENRVLGLVRMQEKGAVLVPVDKKAKSDFQIPKDEMGKAENGDLAIGEIQPASGMRQKKVRIVDVIGRREDPRAISLISLYEAGLRAEFPSGVLEKTKNLKVPPLKNRQDLRSVPLATIDGADARDFDDAVYAEKTDDGYHLIVAIADVAHYVRPGSALDKEAQERGNSTYFPDRVVPMLPEALSNDLCSLRPEKDRACLAMHMWIDREGTLTKHKIVRGLMRSHARLTYEQVQHLYDQKNKKAPAPDMDEEKIWNIIAPLYEAFEILKKAREKRGALDLDLPERVILIDEKCEMTGVKTKLRLDSHKLVEEFMILANVAAAKALEARKAPCVYRIHEPPVAEKLDSAREFLDSFNLSLPKGQVIRPAQLNQILKHAAKLPYAHLINMVILRTQSQAVYSPENEGHFGLGLKRYAHFTSPIRRYADLLVHRSLIGAYNLGPGALTDEEQACLEEICDHISQTERSSMEAERNAIDRFTAAYLSDKIGAEFEGRITGVTRFGLFVTLEESGADGLVPMRSLADDFYVHDEGAHALIGRRSGRVYRLGAQVTVRLKEADGLTGSTVLELAGHQKGADIPGAALQTKKKQKTRHQKHHRRKRRNSRKKK